MDKGRRGFLGGLLGLGPAAGVLLAGEATMPADDFTLGGWRYRWIDYRQVEAMDLVYGIWIAEQSSTGRLAHWTTRGRGDWHQVGNVFDLTGQRGWPDLNGGSPEPALRAAKRRAFLELRRFVGQVPLGE